MKTELLAPAGNLEKAKIALLYGADAVYLAENNSLCVQELQISDWIQSKILLIMHME